MKNLIIILFAIIFSACGTNAQKGNITVDEFESAINKNKVQILDVRTAGEYASGHLDKSLLADWTIRDQFISRVSALNKDIPVYTYCLSGARSEAAANYLREKGYTVYNMAGGINAWKKAGNKIEQAKPVKQISLNDYLKGIPSDKTVLVDFGAVWCPPCKKMEPVLDSLASGYGHKFQLIKIDGGDQTNLVNELKINGFPTFIIYKEGKEIWRKEGLVDKKEFIDRLGGVAN